MHQTNYAGNMTCSSPLSCAILGMGTWGEAVKYWMLRLFLTRRDGDNLFALLDPKQTRQEYLRQVFGGEVRFLHWQKPYVYKPFDAPDDIHSIGVIGREHMGVVRALTPADD